MLSLPAAAAPSRMPRRPFPSASRGAPRQRPLQEVEPVLAPEQLAPVDITGRPEHPPRDRLGGVRRVLLPHRAGLRRREQGGPVQAVLRGDGPQGPGVGDVPLLRPHDDPLTAVLRSGARRLLARAIEAEAEAFLAEMADRRLVDGRARVVRHGHGPERAIQTGIGPVEVRRPEVRDRAPAGSGDRVRFTSRILPRWAWRTKSLEALLPVLYLRGISTGDFQEALAALLGKERPTCHLR